MTVRIEFDASYFIAETTDEGIADNLIYLTSTSCHIKQNGISIHYIYRLQTPDTAANQLSSDLLPESFPPPVSSCVAVFF